MFSAANIVHNLHDINVNLNGKKKMNLENEYVRLFFRIVIIPRNHEGKLFFVTHRIFPYLIIRSFTLIYLVGMSIYPLT